MYRIPQQLQRELKDFYPPFGGSLDEQNRPVRLTAIIPWDEIEKRYARQFSKDLGAPAKRSRMALGAFDASMLVYFRKWFGACVDRLKKATVPF